MSLLSRTLVHHIRCPYSVLRGHFSNYRRQGLTTRNTFLTKKTGEYFYKVNRFCSERSITGITHSPVTSDDLPHHDSLDIVEDGNLLPSEKQKLQNDTIMLKIYDTNRAEDLLSLYAKHQDVMNSNHFLGILNQLRVSVEDGLEEVQNIHGLEEFKDLCHKLWKTSRRMEVNEQLSLLKCLCRLQVSSESKIMQTALQLIRHNINDLELRQLVYLEFLLKKLSSTPLSDGLQVAIPVVIEANLKKEQLEDLSMKEMSQMLSLCVQTKVQSIGTVLEEVYRRGAITSAPVALSILWSLVKMFVTDGKRIVISREDALTREVLIKECLDCIAKDLKSLTQQQIETTLEKLRVAHGKRDYCIYNEQFLDSIAKYAVTEKWDLNALAHTIRKLHKMNFISEDLLYFMVEQVIDQHKEVCDSKFDVLAVLMAFGGCELQHPEINKALDILITHPNIVMTEENKFRRPWVRIAVELLSLDYYHGPLLEIVTSEEFLNVYMSRSDMQFADNIFLLRLHQALVTLGHDSLGVPEKFLSRGRAHARRRPPSKSDLLSRLNRILDNPDHLISGVLTDGDVYIDHLLVTDEDGNSVSVKSADEVQGNIRISSLDIPENLRKIAISNIGSTYVFGPGCRLKGYIRLEQRILEASGFHVVYILQPEIFHLPPDERNLHIKRQIAFTGVKINQ